MKQKKKEGTIGKFIVKNFFNLNEKSWNTFLVLRGYMSIPLEIVKELWNHFSSMFLYIPYQRHHYNFIQLNRLRSDNIICLSKLEIKQNVDYCKYSLPNFNKKFLRIISTFTFTVSWSILWLAHNDYSVELLKWICYLSKDYKFHRNFSVLKKSTRTVLE